MENQVTLTLSVNGKEAEDELLILQQRAKELSDAINDAEHRGDNALRDRLLNDLDNVEDHILAMKEQTKQIVDIMPSLGGGLSLRDFTKIRDYETAISYFKTQSPMLRRFHGLSFYDLGMDFSRFYDFYNLMKDNEKGNYEISLSNGELFTFKDKSELRKIIDDFISSMSTLRNTHNWMSSNGFLKIHKDPGNFLQINDEFEQSKYSHLIDFVSGKINQLQLEIADLKSERVRNDYILGTQHISEKERHSLVMRNLEIEKQIAIKNEKLLSKESEKLAEFEKDKIREELFSNYQIELDNLKSLYDEGYISLKVFNLKERDLRIKLYTDLLQYLKKNSFSYYETQRKLNDLLKQQVIDNIKTIERNIKTLGAKYFGGGKGDNNTLHIGGTNFDLRSNEDKELSYNQTIQALNILRERLVRSTNGDEGKIKKIDLHINHAKRWEEINYLRSIGQDPHLNWKEKIEDFNNWFSGEESSKIISIASNIATNIGSIFSSINEMVKNDLEFRLGELNRYYDREISLAEGNGRKVQHLERKRDREIAKAKNEAQKKQLNYQLFSAIAQNAQNIITAYGSGLQAPWPTSMWLAPAMAGIAAAAGMVQLAVIYKQQNLANSQGYKEGGFTGDGPRDKVGVFRN